MDNSCYLDEMEADLQGWSPTSNPFGASANEHSYGPRPASLVEHSQDQLSSQVSQSLFDQSHQPTPPQHDPFALPPLGNAAWTEYLQDAHLWQLGDPLVSLSQRRRSAFQPLGIPNSCQRARRPAFSAPQQAGPAALMQPPLLQQPDLTKQVLSEIIYRLNAQGVNIEVDTLTAEAVNHIFAPYATPAENTAIIGKEQTHSEPEVQYEPSYPSQAGPVSQADQLDQRNQAGHADIQTNDDIWAADYRAQVSPTRIADGESFQFHNKHNRLHLRTKCFPCHSKKRKCDREKQPNGICSECAHRAESFPGLYDANVICVKEDTQAFRDFKHARAGVHGKAKALGEYDWLMRQQISQDKKAKDKQEKREQEARSRRIVKVGGRESRTQGR